MRHLIDDFKEQKYSLYAFGMIQLNTRHHNKQLFVVILDQETQHVTRKK